MYYYDAKSGKCKKFVYGGCGGNQNKFGKMAECVATCKPELLKNVSLKKMIWAIEDMKKASGLFEENKM